MPICKMWAFFYSYLRASIGSNLAALAAGKIPEINPTKIHSATPEKIHNHGIIKEPPVNMEVMLPTATPNTIPATPPSWQITMASIKN